MAKPYYNTFTGKTSIPVPVQLFGQITSLGTTITITENRDQIKGGDYIYDSTQNEVRKVISFDGQNPILESAFSADITTPIDLYITTRDAKYSSLSVTNIGAADGELENAFFKKREIVDFSDSEGISPITINGTGTEIAVSGI